MTTAERLRMKMEYEDMAYTFRFRSEMDRIDKEKNDE